MRDPHRAFRFLAGTCIVALLSAGCVAPGDGAGDAVAPTSASDAAHVALVVLVTDTAVRPVAGAEVRIVDVDLAARTTDDGTARFVALEGGEYTLEVRAEGYRGATVDVVVDPSGPARAEVVVEPVHEASARILRYEYEGFLECSATTVIITGDCLVLVRALGGPAAEQFNVTETRNVFTFPVPDDWQRIEVVQTWSDGLATTGDGMRINLEPGEASDLQHATRFAVASGGSPLSLTVERGVPHETADKGIAVPDEPGSLRTRTFHNGIGHAGEAPPYLGVGSAVEQRFTVTVAVHAGAA